jgi:hypothetical protein
VKLGQGHFLLHLAVCRFHQQGVAGDAGIVDKAVDAAEVLADTAEQRLDGGLVGDIRWIVLAALAGFMLVQGIYQQSKQYTTIPYSRFQTLLDEDKIDEVWIEQNTIQGTLKNRKRMG